MQMYTGTRLTTAIHRRLLSRFFLREGDVCTQANICIELSNSILSCGMVRCNSKDDFYTAHELPYMIFTGLRIIGRIAR